MLPKYHIIINFFLSLILLFFLKPIYALIFFFSSFLIDIDHYIYYIIEKKRINLFRAYKWFKIKDEKWKKLTTKERKMHSNTFLFLHGIEPMLIIYLISRTYPSLFYPSLLFVVFGFLVHLLEDMVEEVKLGVAERKIFFFYSLYIFFTKEDFTKTIPEPDELF